MYIIRTTTDPAEIVREATQPPPFGPGFPTEQAERADRLEVWGSSINDPGEDFTAFYLIADRVEIGHRRVIGY